MIVLIILASAIVILEALYLNGKAVKCPKCGTGMKTVDGWDKHTCPKCKYTVDLNKPS